jgi:hypothetical protein
MQKKKNFQNNYQIRRHYTFKTSSDWSVVFSGYTGFLNQLKFPPQYNWNIVVSGVKHHSSNPHDLPSFYWIPKLCPYKQRYIDKFAKCSTKPLSKLLTFILSVVKPGVGVTENSSVVWIRCGFWTFYRSVRLHSIKVTHFMQHKTFYFSILDTTNLHLKLKDRLK